MQSLTAPAPSADPAPRAPRGRWIWRLTGALTLAALTCLAIVATVAVTHQAPAPVMMTAVPARTVTITQPVSALNVHSFGSPVKVTVAPGPVQVTESIVYSSDRPRPRVSSTVTRGLLTLNAPSCANSYCSVAFSVTVPAAVAVTADSGGGDVTVTGAAAATIDAGGGGQVFASGVSGPLTVTAEGGGVTVSRARSAVSVDSGGGPVTATTIGGKLTVHAEGGDVQVLNLAGPLTADTGGGPLTATGLAGPTATVTAEGGDVTLGFTTAPASVTVGTGGGSAVLSVPGGPYAVATDSGGGTDSVLVPVSPGAARSVGVSTEGGDLQVSPA
jgi:hypothetical protein